MNALLYLMQGGNQQNALDPEMMERLRQYQFMMQQQERQGWRPGLPMMPNDPGKPQYHGREIMPSDSSRGRMYDPQYMNHFLPMFRDMGV